MTAREELIERLDEIETALLETRPYLSRAIDEEHDPDIARAMRELISMGAANLSTLLVVLRNRDRLGDIVDRHRQTGNVDAELAPLRDKMAVHRLLDE